MSGRRITIDVPEAVYQRFERAAERAHRSVDDIVAGALLVVAPDEAGEPNPSASVLAELAYRSDAALWQAARSTLTPEQRERLEELHWEQGDRPLTTSEQAEEHVLLRRYRETILVRAQAMALLKQRGFSVSDLNQFDPLE